MRGLGYCLIGCAVFYVWGAIFVSTLALPTWKLVLSVGMLTFGAIGIAATAVHLFRNVK